MEPRASTTRTSRPKTLPSILETTPHRTPRSRLARECRFSKSLMRCPEMEPKKSEEVATSPLNPVFHRKFSAIILILAWITSSPESVAAVVHPNPILPIEEKESRPSKVTGFLAQTSGEKLTYTKTKILLHTTVLPFFSFQQQIQKIQTLYVCKLLMMYRY